MAEQAVAGEWLRAQECLGAANLCRENGYYADAISRAYYAIMHAARAALRFRRVSISSRRSSHSGVLNQFGLHLVEPGYIEPAWSDNIKQGYGQRIRADYGVFENFEESDASDACDRADAFLDRILLLLESPVSPSESPTEA